MKDEMGQGVISKYEGLKILSRLLMVASLRDEFEISGDHLCGLGDLILKYIEAKEPSENKTGVSPLSGLQNIQRVIAEGSLGLHGNLSLLEQTLNELNHFIKNDFEQVLEFKKWVEQLLNQIKGSLEKKSPEKTGPKAGQKNRALH
jgi:hypothetical protein